jgi:uncharacterized protein (DUF1778 family)
MSDKKHGNTGNKNAQKGSEPMTERISFRLKASTKKAIEEDARAAGFKDIKSYILSRL